MRKRNYLKCCSMQRKGTYDMDTHQDSSHVPSDDLTNAPVVALKPPEAGGSVISGEGWFVHCLHDLRGGLWYEGPYDEDVAKSRAAECKAAGGWDEVNVLFLPFVKSEDRVYALCPETAAMMPGVPDNPA
jgi:hypothetical protein